MSNWRVCGIIISRSIKIVGTIETKRHLFPPVHKPHTAPNSGVSTEMSFCESQHGRDHLNAYITADTVRLIGGYLRERPLAPNPRSQLGKACSYCFRLPGFFWATYPPRQTYVLGRPPFQVWGGGGWFDISDSSWLVTGCWVGVGLDSATYFPAPKVAAVGKGDSTSCNPQPVLPCHDQVTTTTTSYGGWVWSPRPLLRLLHLILPSALPYLSKLGRYLCR